MKKLNFLSTARFDFPSQAMTMNGREHFRLSRSALIVDGLTNEQLRLLECCRAARWQIYCMMLPSRVSV